MSNQFDQYVQLVGAVRAQYANMSATEKYLALSELKRRNMIEKKYLDEELSHCEPHAMSEVLAQTSAGNSIPVEGDNVLFGPAGRIGVYERRKTSVGFTIENLKRWLSSAMGEAAAREVVNHCVNARKADTALIPKTMVITRVFKPPSDAVTPTA